MVKFIAIVLLVGLTAPAHSDTRKPVRNLVSLAVAARAQVDNDLLVVRLFVEHETRQQSEAAERVNQDMAWALETARQVAAVESQTLEYQTYPVHDERRVTGWRVRQALRLESTDKASLTALLGTLQTRLAIESVGYEISDPVREAVEARLIDAAIARFETRAAQIAKAFGRGGYTLVNVDVSTGGQRPPPRPYAGRALAMEAQVAAPSIEGGVQSLEVGVNGTIELAQP